MADAARPVLNGPTKGHVVLEEGGPMHTFKLGLKGSSLCCFHIRSGDSKKCACQRGVFNHRNTVAQGLLANSTNAMI